MSDTVELVLKIKADQAKKIMGDLADETGRVSDNSKKAGASLDQMAGKVKGAVAVAFAYATKHVIDYKNAINDTARATGLAADQVAGLKLAAEASGMQIESLAAGLRQVPKRMADARRGTGEAIPALKALGLETAVASGKIADAGDLLVAYQERIGSVKNPTEQAAIAAQLFGEAGGQMLVALGDDAKALAAFTDRAKLLGPAFDDGAAGAKALQSAFSDLKLASAGAIDKIMTSLGAEQGLLWAVDSLTDGILYFGTVFGQVISGVVSGLDTYLGRFGTQIDLIAGALEALADGDFGKARSLMGQAASNGAGLTPLGLAADVAGGAFGALDLGAATDAVTQSRSTRGLTRGSSGSAGSGGGGLFGSGGKGQLFEGMTADEYRALLRAEHEAIVAMQRAEYESIVGGDQRFDGMTADEYRAVLRAENEALVAMQRAEFEAGSPGLFSRIMDSIGETSFGRLARRVTHSDVGQAIGAGASSGAGLLGQLASGNGAAIFGPAGGIASGLAAIGQKGAGGVRDQLMGFKDAMIEALYALPDILSEVIPEFVKALVTELIPALIKALPDILLGLLKGIVQLIGDLLNPFKKAGGRRSRAIGGLIDQTGYYLMHEGENVIPANGAGSGTATAQGMRGAGGGQVVVNVNGSVYGSMDTLVRDLDRHIGFGGRGQSTALGN